MKGRTFFHKDDDEQIWFKDVHNFESSIDRNDKFMRRLDEADVTEELPTFEFWTTPRPILTLPLILPIAAPSRVIEQTTTTTSLPEPTKKPNPGTKICPGGFTTIQHNCYRKINKKLTYELADKACKDLNKNAHLPIFTSNSEIEDITTKFGDSYWLAMKRDKQDVYKWVLPNGQEVTYFNWKKKKYRWLSDLDEPSNTGGHEDCVESYIYYDEAKMNDLECDA
ncbi:hypothetical protein WR25_09139 [Diploscapter pachys]|uniref:C-type lectin domain-containing protein n=1 Tax=Diploscapter pachys TaxID=2018661 RepID=A0A2A2LIA4_9BILA|nr:hypothetical protein WR25_09139 [Diploscapter pachys]